MVSKVAVIVAALVLAGACQLPGMHSTCNATIDWVNFVEVGSTQYVGGRSYL
jgi:hypothetical protein